MRKACFLLVAILCLAAVAAYAQFRSDRGRTSAMSRNGVPSWEVDGEFARDVFTFVRIQYDSVGRRGRWNEKWRIDWPDAELNLSYRLQQMTSLKVNPDPIVLQITDPELFNYPFIYIVEPGDLLFSEEEVQLLRKYLLSGGFLMVDDFWGEAEWRNFYLQMKRVFPEREPVDLPIEHEIFHIVFDLKEKPQVPSAGYIERYMRSGITWERPDATEPNYRAFLDDKGRIMVMICHNTDLGDGWEREGEDERYFRYFSEPKAYPMGINIIFYAMTR
jgi:hypothetical protein